MTRRSTLAALAAAITFLTASGCVDEPQIRTYQVPKSAESAPAATPDAGGDHGGGDSHFAWDTPEGWTSSPGSSMRLATLTAPLPDGGTGDCSIIVLGGQGGGIVGNVNRWRGQIGLPEETGESILDEARVVEGRIGEFRVFRLENPDLPDQAFLAAMMPHEGQTVFVKLAAPAAALDSLEPGFLSLCRSLGHPR